jgi:hypothetical protein
VLGTALGTVLGAEVVFGYLLQGRILQRAVQPKKSSCRLVRVIKRCEQTKDLQILSGPADFSS